MSEDSEFRRAEKIADGKIKFYYHLCSYIVVNIILIIVNVVTTYGYWWFYWVTIFWGIAILVQFLKAFVLNSKMNGDYRDSLIEKEMEKMKKE